MIGTLGRAVFSASSFRLFTPSGMTRNGSPRIEEHQVIGKKAVLEFIAPGLDAFSFTIRLDVMHGVVPLEELEKLRDARDNGKILPFTMAGKYLGDWLITDMSESWKHVDGRGRILVAEAQVSLKEARAK